MLSTWVTSLVLIFYFWETEKLGRDRSCLRACFFSSLPVSVLRKFISIEFEFCLLERLPCISDRLWCRGSLSCALSASSAWTRSVLGVCVFISMLCFVVGPFGRSCAVLLFPPESGSCVDALLCLGLLWMAFLEWAETCSALGMLCVKLRNRAAFAGEW